MVTRLVLFASVLVVGGCAASAGRPRVVAEADDACRAALFDRVKAMEGEWEAVDEAGNVQGSSVFRVSSAGSVVREVMFPGAEHEMTNVYHMDGPTLVMTHYCAAGNQPRMRARPNAAPGTVVLEFDSVTNLTDPDGEYMGALTITIKDRNHATQTWTSYKHGKPQGPTVFEIRRKGA